MQEGRLYSVALTVLNFDSLEVLDMGYQDLSSQAGPLLAYSLGVIMDGRNNSVA